MPTILRSAGLRIVIHPNDHRPAHVHVGGRGCEAVFILNCPTGPPELRESFGFKLPDLNRIEYLIGRELEVLCKAWSERHGDF